MKLLTTSTKIEKSNKNNKKYLAIAQYLSPYKISGKNLCPHASKSCAEVCLNTSGFGRFNNVQQARLNRSRLFLDNFDIYVDKLYKEIKLHIKKCKRQKIIPAVRLNATSDINWKKYCPDIFSTFSTVQFWDYTKDYAKCIDLLLNPISNYHLTFSRSENNEIKCMDLLNRGLNVAIVFEKLPKYYKGFPVINADNSDFRWLDDSRTIAGLTPKGKAKQENLGFVVRVK